MSERLKESMSAVMDGEADEFELRRVLDEISRNPLLQETWDRYHVIGAQIRGEQPAHALLGAGSLRPMADEVWETLGLEAAQADDPEGDWQVPVQALTSAAPALVSSAQSPQPNRVRRFGARTSVAVAASVALMVTAGFFALETDDPAAAVAQQDINIDGPVLQVTTEASASDLQRANAYMLHHVQHTALNKAGVASFVKVVTFEKPQ